MRPHLTLLASMLVLTACGPRQPEPENSASTGAAASASAANAAGAAPAGTASKAKVSFEPATYENCTPPKLVVGTVKWDASASRSATVDVKALRADGAEDLFATEGPVGSKQTAEWLGPGSVIIVRDHETGTELGRGTAGSRPCGT
ncbi:hypothetical protein [Cognatilysobacter lacus]|uniref:Lipoprotein n=1 Tax=Cognatilysobacter lacus TaxID=1643323 RepID=A0A5D8Z973_9GAMM|nr:hypothetical protein [Lysobacter lacus]TZF91190.1 hypothetical protein FW784_02570 [Lysobacter lacus]